jgi:hypothetical protein
MNLKRIYPIKLIPFFWIFGVILSFMAAAIDSDSTFPETLKEGVKWIPFLVFYTLFFVSILLLFYSVVWGILFIIKFVFTRISTLNT